MTLPIRALHLLGGWQRTAVYLLLFFMDPHTANTWNELMWASQRLKGERKETMAVRV